MASNVLPLPLQTPQARAKLGMKQTTRLSRSSSWLAGEGNNPEVPTWLEEGVPLHADAEPEMGSVIASVTLIAPGADRLFLLRRKDGSVVFAERLSHGSLLIMARDTQKNFRHEVPKEPGITCRAST
jgi:2OG-Fe(II) oxygenase superfamily